MDTYILGDDVHVACLPAGSFPDGIEQAFKDLKRKLPPKDGRHYFGISRPDETGEIFYRAGADNIDSAEAEKLGLEMFTIKRGSYNTYYIDDYRNSTDGIARSFELLLGQAEADPNGYCIEWYIGDNDVKCMVRSADTDYP